VLAGFLSHLVLDEIYAVEWKSGQWRFKKSFGTALKFWGDDGWANFSTYAKLAIVAMIILGEPTVLERIESRHPGFAQQYQQFQNQLNSIEGLPATQGALDAARTAIAPFSRPMMNQDGTFPPATQNSFPPYSAAPAPTPSALPGYGAPTNGWPPPATRDNYGTAQRPGPYYPQ
jgi:hypothetical protein